MKIAFVIIRDVVATNASHEFINSTSFRVIEIEKTDEEVFFENEKIEVVLKSKTQQLRCSEIRAMCKNENYYENFFKVLMNKLIKMQVENFVMQRIRT